MFNVNLVANVKMFLHSLNYTKQESGHNVMKAQ